MRIVLLVIPFLLQSVSVFSQEEIDTIFYARGTVSIVQVDIFCEAIITGEITLSNMYLIFSPNSSNKKIVQRIVIPITEIETMEDKLSNTFQIRLYNSSEYKFAIKSEKKFLSALNELLEKREFPAITTDADKLLNKTLYTGNVTLCNTFYGTPLLIKPLRIPGNLTLTDSLFSYHPSKRKTIIKNLNISRAEIKKVKTKFLSKGFVIKLYNKDKYKFVTKDNKDLIIRELSTYPGN